jgi:predicted phosphodiesterase
VATLGPRPNAVIEILGELGCRCITGNHDEFLLDAELVHTYSGAPQVVASINWTRCRLSRVQLDFLRGFERSCKITLAKSTVQLFHGSPRSHMEDILASTPPEALDAMLAATTATVLAGGHTHIQMPRQHDGAGKSWQRRTAVQRLCCWADTNNFEPRRIRYDRGV